MIFSTGLCLPDFVGEDKKLHQIMDIVVFDPMNINDIFAVCKTYITIGENEHFCAYSVDKESLQEKFSLINIEHFLSKKHYPLTLHNISNEYLFRLKRF